MTDEGGASGESRLRAWHLVVMSVCAVLLLAALAACWRRRVRLCGGRVGFRSCKLQPPIAVCKAKLPPPSAAHNGLQGAKSHQPGKSQLPRKPDLEAAEVPSSSSQSIEIEPTPSTSELQSQTQTYV